MKGLKRWGKKKKAGGVEELSEEEVWEVMDESGSGQTREAGGSEERRSQQLRRQKSAPVNIPENRRRSEDDGNKKDGDGDGDGDEEEERLPPHEYLAREYARSQTAFQGAGRNGKSRDLSVRNAIWRRTGFSG